MREIFPPILSQPDVDRFHAHLDECAQCMKNPFDLCPTGAELIQAPFGKGPVNGAGGKEK